LHGGAEMSQRGPLRPTAARNVTGAQSAERAPLGARCHLAARAKVAANRRVQANKIMRLMSFNSLGPRASLKLNKQSERDNSLGLRCRLERERWRRRVALVVEAPAAVCVPTDRCRPEFRW
jgi:hypothetical protein